MISLPALDTILPIVAAALVFIVINAKIYLQIRRRFPISVNCWFCNQWTKVAYDNRDSFDCPNCSQYNGFTQDGDYNKVIPEQSDEFLNNRQQLLKRRAGPPSNGLCKLCNNNQQLKVFQLAHFVPLSEDNYDVEIEHFEAQLEKAYKLCKKCNKTLQRTISEQNAWVFGNRVKQTCTNGFSTANLACTSKTGYLRPFLANLNRLCSIFVTTFDLLHVLTFYSFVTNLIPAPHDELIRKLTLPVQFEASYLTSNVLFVSPFILNCFLGFSTQIIASLLEFTPGALKLNRFLCWGVLLLTHWLNKSHIVKILVVHMFCTIYLLATTFSEEVKERKSVGKPRNREMNRFVRNLDRTCSDLSELSDLADYSTNTSSSTSKSSSYSLKASPTSQFAYQPARAALTRRQTFDSELNRGITQLNLSGLNFKPPHSPVPSVFSMQSVARPKPVLSPPKFVNSWVNNTSNVGYLPTLVNRQNLSRSSSESSGFGSQNNENFAQGPLFGPERNYAPFRGNTFYPNLNPNSMLFLRGGQSCVAASPPSCHFSSRFSSVSANDDVRLQNGGAMTSGLFKTWPDMQGGVRPAPAFPDLTANSLYSQ